MSTNKQNRQDTYNKHLEELNKNIEDLLKVKADMEAEKNPNWGHIGSVVEVNKKLHDALLFTGYRDEE